MSRPEPISTHALFSSGTVVPKTIFIANRPVSIKRIIFQSNKRLGNTEIITFSLASDTAVYEVDFNKSTLEWQLKNIFLEG